MQCGFSRCMDRGNVRTLAIHKFAHLINSGKPIPVIWRRLDGAGLHLH